MEQPVDSPCNSICKIDPATRLCMGCFRTLDEIAAWSRSTNGEQAAINANALGRLGGDATVRQCAHCRTYFSCGAAGQCWCTAAGSNASKDSCLCPICLRRARSLGREFAA